MSDILSQLSPQSVIILGVAWLVREILGFVRKMIEPLLDRIKTGKNGDNGQKVMMDLMAKNLIQSNEALKEILIEIKLQRQDIKHLKETIKDSP